MTTQVFSEEKQMLQAKIGLIGGSGLYAMDGLKSVTEIEMDTPFGKPSDALMHGYLNDIAVVFLARHARGHRLLPSEVPYRANIHALRQMGVDYVLSFSAVGSLREDMAPLDMVLPDQFIDLTKTRASTFFGAGVVAHVSMADPVCPALRAIMAEAIHATQTPQSGKIHMGGTYVCIEGPQFSSRAESHLYQGMKADIIGMTNMPEAKLAREAQMAYATLAMVTDYDCWHPHEAAVSADMAINNLMKNAAQAQAIAAYAIELIAAKMPPSIAHTALSSALITPLEAMPEARRVAIQPFFRF
jgi:5'-methylthioadenosine phosphorylase